MSRKISTLLALALCIGMMAACTPSESDTTAVDASTNETPQSEPDTTSAAETLEGDTTVKDTEAEETTQTEPETAYTDESSEIETEPQAPYTENREEIPADLIFLNPDGEEFADELQNYNRGVYEPRIRYWDTGKVLAKFELIPDAENNYERRFRINGHIIDHAYVFNIKQILVEDEYIIVVYGGTDVNTEIFIYDHNCNILLGLYYLSTSGLVNAGEITVTDNKITLHGTRLTHGPSITMGRNRFQVERFSEYSDYVYVDPLYDYSQITGDYDVYFHTSNIYGIKSLNPEEKISAVFEMEYLGDGKFSKLNIVSYETLREAYTWLGIEE